MFHLLLPLAIATYRAPLESFQTAWQASQPIPVQVYYDVPVSSLVESLPPLPPPPPSHDKVLGNAYAVRLHPPEESTQTMMDSLDAVKYEQEVHVHLHSKSRATTGHVLLETLGKSIDGMVTDLMAPIRALPNPFA